MYQISGGGDNMLIALHKMEIPIDKLISNVIRVEHDVIFDRANNHGYLETPSEVLNMFRANMSAVTRVKFNDIRIEIIDVIIQEHIVNGILEMTRRHQHKRETDLLKKVKPKKKKSKTKIRTGYKSESYYKESEKWQKKFTNRHKKWENESRQRRRNIKGVQTFPFYIP